jgi:hypothetical protein
MRHHAKLACSVAFLFILAITAPVGAASAPGEGVGALLDLLSTKGVISAEEAISLRSKSGSPATTDFKAVIELLQSKGAISKEEAEKLQQHSAYMDKEPSPAVTPIALADGVIAENVTALPEKEIKPVIEVLREQGVLGTDEASQLAERVGKKWNVAEEDDRIAAADDEIEYNRTTLPKDVVMSEIVILRQQAIINDSEAERIRERFLHKLSLERIAASIDENMRRDVKTQVAEKIVPVPDWTKRIKFGGDIRLRYEGDFFDGSGSAGGFDTGNGIFVKPDNPTQLMNSTVDRHQLRIRARLNVVAKINDEVEVGIGLATGTTTNPVSTNATLGDSLNKKNFLLDLGYLKWTPFSNLTLWGGRFANPWFGSDLVWDQDVNFDGVAFSYRPQLTSTLSMFLTGGAFPIQEVELSSHDKWLYAGQLGVQYRDDKKLTAKLAAAFYDFENVTGTANDPSRPGANDFTAPLFQQKGNTLFDIDPSTSIKTAYAAEFRELNIGGSLDLGFWDPLRVVLMGDYVNNIGYDSASVNSLTGHDVKKETEGYQFGISVGYPDTRDLGQWKVLASYKYLEADAVIDAFTDSDFHLGGTNAKGWIVGGDLGVGKNVWLSTRWITTNEISGPPLAIDVFQFNANARF